MAVSHSPSSSVVAEEKLQWNKCSKGEICSNSLFALPQNSLIFIIQPVTFLLIKQCHGLCIELAVVYGDMGSHAGQQVACYASQYLH